jgi:hypothetical protein
MQSADIGKRFMNDQEMFHFVGDCISEMKYPTIIDYSLMKSIFSNFNKNNTDWYSQRISFSYILGVVSIISFLDSRKLEV